MKDILIVEDLKHERERLEQLFVEAGYVVTACESVIDAEQALKNSNYRLVILDIGLGDKSGSTLFSTINRTGRETAIVVFTGNPSVHLKQRLLAEGASDYVVKGSVPAGDSQMLQRIRELIGESSRKIPDGIDLLEFIDKYLTPKSRKLFFNLDRSLPECQACGSANYLVSFSHQTQLPPEISGQVVCAACGKLMDPEIS